VDSWASFLSLYPSYFIAGILLPFVYASWRFTMMLRRFSQAESLNYLWLFIKETLSFECTTQGG
ncbi:MAG: hypothetical protein R6V32_05885, partial [Bacteroidales bacterium]